MFANTCSSERPGMRGSLLASECCSSAAFWHAVFIIICHCTRLQSLCAPPQTWSHLTPVLKHYPMFPAACSVWFPYLKAMISHWLQPFAYWLGSPRTACHGLAIRYIHLGEKVLLLQAFNAAFFFLLQHSYVSGRLKVSDSKSICVCLRACKCNWGEVLFAQWHSWQNSSEMFLLCMNWQ